MSLRPAPARTSFVGREKDLETLLNAIDCGSGLVSLVGPGGVGKSRLALEACGARAPGFEGGARVCDLTRARTAQDMARVVFESLGRGTGDGGADDRVADDLRRRSPTLLVLDNLEHLVDAGALAVGAWIEAAPHHCLLVTSQVALGLGHEHVQPVEPLPPADALALLVARVRDAAPDIHLDSVALEQLGELADRLDRLPLAIELAASRAPILTPAELLTRVTDRFALLRSRRRDRDDRHATLENTIGWAYGLLEPPLQEALGACAVFVGSFDLDAALAVLPASDVALLDVVQTLVERSLLVSERVGRGTRFRLLESVREFLCTRSDLSAARARYEAFYLARHTPRRGAPLATVSEDAAQLAWIVEHGSPGASARAAYALGPLIEASATRGEHLAHLARASERASVAGDERLEALCRIMIARATAVADPEAATRSLERTDGLDDPLVASERHRTRAFLMRHDGRLDGAIAELEQATRGRAGLRLAHVRQDQAVVHMLAGRVDAARGSYREAIAAYRADGDDRAAAEANAQLGVLELDNDDDAARALLESALEAHRAAGEHRREGIVSSNLGVLEHQSGNLEAAEARWSASLVLHRAVGNPRFEAFALAGLGAVLHERGEIDDARALIERSCTLLADLHDPRWEGWALSRRGAVRASAGELDAARADFGAARTLLEESEAHEWLGAVAILEQLVGGAAPESPARSSAERIAERLARDVPRRRAARADDHALAVATDGSWFERSGARVDLARRHAIRRILERLVTQRELSPDEPLLTPELVAVGWPGERMREQSGSARVYTAIRTLRRAGLEDVLISAHGGYLLHPAVPLRVVAPAASGPD